MNRNSGQNKGHKGDKLHDESAGAISIEHLNVRALRKETERESEVESALWLKLELDTSAKHTIRVSWPAFVSCC